MDVLSTSYTLTESIRPMTSNKSAGYSSLKPKKKQASNYKRGSSSQPHHNNNTLHPNFERDTNTFAIKAERLEKNVNDALSQSIFTASDGDYDTALKYAHTARKKNAEIASFREKHNLEEQMNFDLGFAVLFNLASIYERKQMFVDALNIYNSMIAQNGSSSGSSKMENVSRVRVHIGNIYYAQQKYDLAIKMYRMSLDQIGDISSRIKIGILRNIGNAFIKLGQFVDAIQSFESIVEFTQLSSPQQPLITHCDLETAFNLIVCYYTLGDKEKMKKSFIQLLNCTLSLPVDRSAMTGIAGSAHHHSNDDDDDDDEHDDAAATHSDNDAHQRRAADTHSCNDEYAMYIKSEWRKLGDYIKQSIQLIGKVIITSSGGDDDDDYSALSAGYDWVIEHLHQMQVKHEHSSEQSTHSGVHLFFDKLVLHVVKLKGIEYLKHNRFEDAIELFNDYNAQNTNEMNIYNNLSFIQFLKCEYSDADKYSLHAVSHDRYNASSLVNRANCLYVYDEYEAAKEMYLEAIGVEADCIEAIYNLGVICKKMGNYTDALQAFKKLNKIDTDYSTQSTDRDVQIMYQICHLYELVQEHEQAIKWYKILHSIVPSDAHVLVQLANLYKVYVKDETLIYHNYLDAYKLNKCNIGIISWIGIWYINNSLYENAIEIFETAALIECNEIKWKLMIASCYRRMRNFERAIHIYDQILRVAAHENDEPIQLKCLQYLCTIMKQIEHPQLNQYQSQLDSLQNSNDMQLTSSSVVAAAAANLQHTQPSQNFTQQQQSMTLSHLNQNNDNDDDREEEQDWAEVDIDDELLPS